MVRHCRLSPALTRFFLEGPRRASAILPNDGGANNFFLLAYNLYQSLLVANDLYCYIIFSIGFRTIY